jgi:hypothetical protein
LLHKVTEYYRLENRGILIFLINPWPGNTFSGAWRQNTPWLLLHQYGGTYVYTYSGNDGVEIARFEINKNDCN